MSGMATLTDGDRPRVSILIPNFNNGRASSCEGDVDLIAQLLESLHDTLADDPTPLEVLAWDDGSTDDSLATLRAAADRTWRGGQPFITLTEAPHTGVLARHANRLVEQARGDILVRLDGDIVCLTRHWVKLLCDTFDNAPARLGVIGPKQLCHRGLIHAFGDFVLHPRGYTHVGQGLDRYAFRHPLEVDHVMGAFYCFKREVYDQVGGFDESFLRGQTIDFGLRARLAGWCCYCVPHIEYVHFHGTRPARETTADSCEGVDRALATFEDKWGFSRVAPDLDVVRERYKGTPLLWNARLFGAGASDLPAVAPSEPLKLADSDWSRLAQDPAIRQRIELRGRVAVDLVRQTTRPRLIGVVGCGDGVMVHALASQGYACVGVERDAARAAFANVAIQGQPYPPDRQRPQVRHQPQPTRLPLDDGEVDMLLLLDVLEQSTNPVGLLTDARRVLAKDGYCAVVSRRGRLDAANALDLERPLLWREVQGLLKNTGWLVLSDPAKDDPAREIVIFARNVLGRPEMSGQSVPSRALAA
jgi:GT2 family glycosyltransferase/SAM-dependent methyltransferase